jgi:hypothetical protein
LPLFPVSVKGIRLLRLTFIPKTEIKNLKKTSKIILFWLFNMYRVNKIFQTNFWVQVSTKSGKEEIEASWLLPMDYG